MVTRAKVSWLKQFFITLWSLAIIPAAYSNIRSGPKPRHPRLAYRLSELWYLAVGSFVVPLAVAVTMLGINELVYFTEIHIIAIIAAIVWAAFALLSIVLYRLAKKWLYISDARPHLNRLMNENLKREERNDIEVEIGTARAKRLYPFLFESKGTKKRRR